jgi:hypothetical protein
MWETGRDGTGLNQHPQSFPGFRLGKWMRPALACILFGLLIAPFFVVEVPPLTDYPNHLARAYVLHFGAKDPWLSRMYAPHWDLIPNLAIDLILPPLLGFFPLSIAGRLVAATAVLLPLCSVAIYNRALFGGWFLWPAASVLVAFNALFLLGLFNFLLGVAAAFAVAAFWVRYREPCPLLALTGTVAGTVVIYFCHIIALSLLAALIGGYEIERFVNSELRRNVVCHVFTAIGVFSLVVVLYSNSPTAHATGPMLWSQVSTKLIAFFMPVMNYNVALDFLTASTLAVFMALAVVKKWLILPPSAAITGGFLFIAYFISPFHLKGGAFFDVRFIIMLGYLLFAGLRESDRVSRLGMISVLITLLSLAAVRMGTLITTWQQQNEDVAQLRGVISEVAPGSRVLVAQVGLLDSPEYWREAPRVRIIDGLVVGNYHLSALLLIERHAFFQTFFSNPSQQPIAVQPQYSQSASANAEWGPPSFSLLDRKSYTEEELAKYPYLENWESKFDYVLVMNAGGLPAPGDFLRQRLEPLKLADVAATFRISQASRRLFNSASESATSMEPRLRR